MSSKTEINQVTLLGDYLEIYIEGFLKDRKSQNLSKGTIDFYKKKLKRFAEYCNSQEVRLISQITPSLIRDYLIILEERGHNEGGVLTHYKSLKAFLRWYEIEEEPEWKNPISKVKAPRVSTEPIEGISREEFDLLLKECTDNDFLGERDKAILYTLYDTGVRASELCNIALEDINLMDNSILIRQGKGRKPRYVFYGKKTKKQLRKYLKIRGVEGKHLFTNRSGDKMIYNTLRQLVRRLVMKADLRGIGLHDFRRAFCLNCLNKGIPEITIARLLGHTTTQLIGRYAKQSTLDLQNGYKSVIDE
jgi:integrase/recombinase XerD